jgi:hypothetical protein
MQLRDRIAEAQKKLSLNNKAMAAELRISHEWLGKILNGHVEGSGDIGLRLDELFRRRQMEVSSCVAGARAESGGHVTIHATKGGMPVSISCIDPASEPLLKELWAKIQMMLTSTEGDSRRLIWLLEEITRLQQSTRHWHSHNKGVQKAITGAEATQRARLVREGISDPEKETGHSVA